MFKTRRCVTNSVYML